MIFYLDDILVLANTKTLVCQHRDYVLKLLLQVRFKRNQKKCRLTPSQTFPYLRLEWSSITMQVSLPQTKLDPIRQLIVVLQRTPTVCKKDCMALLGKVNFATIAIPLARLHCRPLQFCLPRMNHQNLTDSRIRLSKEVHTRPVFGHRQIEPYQLPGAEDCFVCSSALETSAEKPGGFSTVGQHYSCCLPSKGGGHSIQIATLPSGGNIDVSRSTGHIGTTKLPTRSNESSGRCSVAIEEGR